MAWPGGKLCHASASRLYVSRDFQTDCRCPYSPTPLDRPRFPADVAGILNLLPGPQNSSGTFTPR